MIEAKIGCSRCGEVLAISARNASDLYTRLFGAVLACHCSPSHLNHAMQVSTTYEAGDHDAREFFCRCLHPSCAQGGVGIAARIPPYRLGAEIIAFHTAHEGHPIEFGYDDVVTRSPMAPGTKFGWPPQAA